MHRSLLMVAACLLAANTASGDEDAELARLNIEAKGLFAQLLKDRDAPIETCEIEPRWSRYGVPYQVAHAFLGLEVRADLQNIDGTQSPAELLVSAGVPKEAICDDAARDRYVTSREHMLRTMFKLDAKPEVRGFYSYKSAYSFPAFDRDFTRAIVVRVGTAFPHFYDDEGRPKRATISGGSVAYTYRRESNAWHMVEAIEMANWD